MKTAPSLRDFFEVDARHVAAATLSALAPRRAIDAKVVAQAFKDLEIDPEKVDPATSEAVNRASRLAEHARSTDAC